jgi:aspartyl protease family protein
MSSGFSNLVRTISSWCATFAILAYGLTHQDQVRSLVDMLANDYGAASTAQRELTGTQGPDVDRAPSNKGSVGRAELRRSRNGHFYADAYINGRPIRVLVDTGASAVALSSEDAAVLGIFPRESDFRFGVNTANGTTRVAVVRLESVQVGDVVVDGVQAVVAQPGNQVESLLGMSFLRRLRVAFQDDLMTLER